MACNGPLSGWRSRSLTAKGMRRVVFNAAEAYRDLWQSVPCGKCYGCRLDRAREWAVRCVHEASLWPQNCFVTLTYSSESLPMVGGLCTLRPADFVRFMKRLRKVKAGVRFLQAGEYGKYGRPHHHALLFNCAFPDRVLHSRRPMGDLFRSAELEGLWPFGYSSIGDVTMQSAGYVARYTLKKVGAPVLLGDPRVAEYMTMSRRPGIGAGWLSKFRGDVFPSDEVVLRGGVRMKPPRYYDELWKREDPEGFERMKAARVAAIDRDEDPRGVVKEECLKRKVRDFLKRGDA